MSGNDPLNPENLQQMLQQMLQMLGGAGPNPFGPSGDPWVQAKKVAETIAAQKGTDANIDPKVRLAIEDLSRVAELHARQRPGVNLPATVQVEVVSRRTWTSDAVDAYRPFFDRFIEALQQNSMSDLALGGEMAELEASDELGAMNQMFSQMMGSMAPLMVAGSAGSMLGYLGQGVIATYDLPVPRPDGHIQVVPDGIEEIAGATGAPVAEVQMYVLIHELIAHAVLRVPHVAARLESLYMDFASAFRPNPDAIMEEIGDVTDFSQILQISSQMNDPEVLLRMMRSRTHDLLMPQLDALVAAVLGFVEHSTMTACASLMTGHPAIRDALRERRTQQHDAEAFMERLLGINITDETLDRGAGFVAGVIERAGDEGLERLWADELDLPTAAEVDAPGLWLERIGLGDSEALGFEIPDDLSGLE
ncbi:MAG: zinc-dependent metalloprotease [Acidimicrobiia bacterium]|nr:zinc-dependent metalloprotease [Acidimicrobiia bacterium]